MKYSIKSQINLVEVKFDFSTKDSYILLPACAYNGNKFKCVYRKYSPYFLEDELSLNPEIIITELPHLSKTLPSKIEVTSGDTATPCFGLFEETTKTGFLLFTKQAEDGTNIGITFEEFENSSVLTLQTPVNRSLFYNRNMLNPANDPKIDVNIDIFYEIIDFDCESIEELFEVFFEQRTKYYDVTKKCVTPFSKGFEIAEEKFNNMNYIENGNYYGVGTKRNNYHESWQAGWVGGGISTLPLLAKGSDFTKQRCINTLDFAFKLQSEIGFFYPEYHIDKIIYEFANRYDDSYHFLLIRRHTDMVYYILKQITAMEKMGMEVPEKYYEKIQLACNALVNLYDRYGQIGQTIDCETGEIRMGGSSAGGLASAGLMIAYERFKNEDYKRVAIALGKLYYERDIKKGVTTGGPVEILQSPDSESVFAILESMVVLYEYTKDEYWLNAAKNTAYQCSSWVLSYDYIYKKNCEFGRLDIKTNGSVFANVQNKHSAPGICTMSATSLLKLYRFTKDKRFLQLMEDISRFIIQCMSRKGNEIYTRGDDRILLPEGFINERVNTSDWETESCIGGVFFGSCWSETSQLLTYLEIPSIYMNLEDDSMAVSDHVNAVKISENTIKIENPTEFDATLTLLIEENSNSNLYEYYNDKFQTIEIKANSSIKYKFK